MEDFHTYYVSNNNILVHNECTPSNTKNYSAEEISDKYGITTDQYHKEVKPKIKSKAPPNERLVGRNPNILLTKTGDIAYQGAKGRGFQKTGLNIIDIINELHLK